MLVVKNCGGGTKHQFPRQHSCRLPDQIITTAAGVGVAGGGTIKGSAIIAISTTTSFRVGQRVSFSDQSLKRHVGEIVRLNQRTATVHCDGRAWRVAFALLQHVTDVTP